MLIWISRLFFLAAIGLLVWAGVLFVVSETDVPARVALIVEEQQKDLGELTAGAHAVTFRVKNTSRLDQRIVGMSEG